jgi:hypothetical protein
MEMTTTIFWIDNRTGSMGDCAGRETPYEVKGGIGGRSLIAAAENSYG